MSRQPTLKTERLVLRPFTRADAPDVQRLAGAREVVATTLRIPHPYPDGAAEEWIAKMEPAFESGAAVTFAITARDGGAFMGAIGLVFSPEHRCAELGYWIGKPYWNRGYTTEAARAVVAHGFCAHDLHRIEAHCFIANPASGRVLEKIGMQVEGELRDRILKWGEFHSLRYYAMLRGER